MSIRSETLRQYGRDLQADVNSGTVLMGKFIIDCANDLERYESDFRGVDVLLTKARASLNIADKIVGSILKREKK